MSQTLVLGEGIRFPQTVKGWAVKTSGNGFEETSYVVEGPLKSDEVFVRLLACGYAFHNVSSTLIQSLTAN
jgi:hypothetical protein